MDSFNLVAMTKKAEVKSKKAAPSKGAMSNGNGAGKGAAANAPTVSGTLAQLARIRAQFPELSPEVTAEFMSQHDAEACRKRGGETKAADIFKIGRNWALTMGENPDDPGFHPLALRWFLDCLTLLGMQLEGRATSNVPSVVSQVDDVQRKAVTALANLKRRLTAAAGTNEGFKASLAASLKTENALDPRIGQLEGLASLVESWGTAKERPPLAAHRITKETATELRAIVKALHESNANKKAPQQLSNRDSPAINEIEGRTLFIMRTIWDELAEARRSGESQLMLYVTRSLLRGMDLRVKAKGNAEDDTGVDEEDVSDDEEAEPEAEPLNA
jgi:hypothetical protein